MFDNFNVNVRKNKGFLTYIPYIPIPEYSQSNTHLNLVSNKVIRLKLSLWRDKEADFSSISPTSFPLMKGSHFAISPSWSKFLPYQPVLCQILAPRKFDVTCLCCGLNLVWVENF